MTPASATPAHSQRLASQRQWVVTTRPTARPASSTSTVYFVSNPRPAVAPIASHQRGSSEFSMRSAKYAIRTHHRKSKPTYWNSAPWIRETDPTATASAAISFAQRPPPSSPAISAVTITTAHCAAALKARNPTSDAPKRSSATRAMAGVSGGYAT